jgi:hypothetical protein
MPVVLVLGAMKIFTGREEDLFLLDPVSPKLGYAIQHSCK